MSQRAAIIGAGPAGLMAADVLSAHGWAVTVYDRMASAGRKFLMAGRGGLNLTHSEPMDAFLIRYGEATDWARPILSAFGPQDLIAWAKGLGQETFTGSSGRVFPKTMKASPLLRAWLARLAERGVAFRLRHRWQGWGDDGTLIFEGPDGAVTNMPDATVLAMGGGSWAKLGSDGSWADILRAQVVDVAPLAASNCGIQIGWSDVFRSRFAGTPLSGIAASAGDKRVRGEAMVTQSGLEGGAIYGLGAELRRQRAETGGAIVLDLRPEMSEDALVARLDAPRRGDSASNFLRKRLALAPVAIHLLRESGHDPGMPDPRALAAAIKGIRLKILGFSPIDRAISTAGGISRSALDADLRVKTLSNVYAAGEMIDWDAPTGGYLLQMCFASGVHAARRICGI